MRKLRVGIIGLGVGEQHLLAYQGCSECEVVSLCDFSEEKLAQAKARYPKCKLFRCADELIADPEIDVISVASYDDSHCQHVVKGLNSGKHVFVEKPLCCTRDELRTIKQAWERQGGKVKLATNVVLRGAPLYQWLKDRLAAGYLGDIYAFDGDYLFGRIDKITHGWRKNVTGYSVLAGGGIHLIDLLVWLTGQRPTRVFAMGNRICTEGTDFLLDDYVTTTLQCPSGLVARITANFGCVHRHQHVVRVFGKAATFLYDDAGPRCHGTRDPVIQAEAITLSALPPSKGCLIGDFVDAVRNNRNIDRETQEHFDVFNIIAACDRSLQSRSITEVQYL